MPGSVVTLDLSTAGCWWLGYFHMAASLWLLPQSPMATSSWLLGYFHMAASLWLLPQSPMATSSWLLPHGYFPNPSWLLPRGYFPMATWLLPHDYFPMTTSPRTTSPWLDGYLSMATKLLPHGYFSLHLLFNWGTPTNPAIATLLGLGYNMQQPDSLQVHSMNL